jgi:hypothetical protein
MGNFLNRVTPIKATPLPLTHEQRVAKARQHRAIERALLREFDAVVEELDHAKENPLLADQIKVVCESYMEVLQRLNRFYRHGIIPPVAECGITEGKLAPSRALAEVIVLPTRSGIESRTSIRSREI